MVAIYLFFGGGLSGLVHFLNTTGPSLTKVVYPYFDRISYIHCLYLLMYIYRIQYYIHCLYLVMLMYIRVYIYIYIISKVRAKVRKSTPKKMA